MFTHIFKNILGSILKAAVVLPFGQLSRYGYIFISCFMYLHPRRIVTYSFQNKTIFLRENEHVI